MTLKPIIDEMNAVLPKLDALASDGSLAAEAAAATIRQMKKDLKDACQQVLTIGS